MTLLKRKSLLSLLLLMVCLSSCDDAPDLTPHFVDTDLKTCREYEVIDQDRLTLAFKQSWPIEHCNGYFAIPGGEFKLWKEYLLKKKLECN